MSPPGRRSGPDQSPSRRDRVPAAVISRVPRQADYGSRRAVETLRLPPLEGRHGDGLAARDPLLPWPPPPRRPSTFGPTSEERIAHARRLLAEGWGPWEIQLVLVAPGAAAA